MHDFVGKLGSNGVVRERFVEVGEGSGRGDVTPVQQVIQLENERIHYEVVTGMFHIEQSCLGAVCICIHRVSVLNHHIGIFTVDNVCWQLLHRL